jgi:hypothetical protein
MLGEIAGLSQPAGPGRRRWFADEELDLIVYYSDAGTVEGFELCYGKTGAEGSFTWKKTGGLTHAAVDQGEDLPTKNRTPIHVPGPAPRAAAVLGDFEARSSELDPALRQLVRAALSSTS